LHWTDKNDNVNKLSIAATSRYQSSQLYLIAVKLLSLLGHGPENVFSNP